jgi:hypothetical protein
MKILLFSLLSVLNWALTYAVQRWDRGRLTEAQRARAWNAASWGAAVYWFGFASMVPWFWVTRQRWRAWRWEGGLGQALTRSAWLLMKGALAAAALFAVLWGATEGLSAALGVGSDF